MQPSPVLVAILACLVLILAVLSWTRRERNYFVSYHVKYSTGNFGVGYRFFSYNNNYKGTGKPMTDWDFVMKRAIRSGDKTIGEDEAEIVILNWKQL